MMNKNEKGFALVLSLILLLVMSLMGGALIVISSGDHQSNNTSDQYQQAFYVAETGLLEGEKNIINQFLGPWGSGGVRDLLGRSVPINQNDVTETNCFKSFRNIKREGFKATNHVVNQNFGKLIEPIFGVDTASEVDPLTGDAKVMEKFLKEGEYLKRFRYEFFSVNIGSAPYLGTGSSIKKAATNSQSLGTAYKIYACGFYVAKGTGDYEYDGFEEIIIPLETVIVMPN